MAKRVQKTKIAGDILPKGRLHPGGDALGLLVRLARNLVSLVVLGDQNLVPGHTSQRQQKAGEEG